MTPEEIARDLRSAVDEMRRTGESAATDAVTGPLLTYENAANQIGESWSESNLGYHARVYYTGFQQPPPDALLDFGSAPCRPRRPQCDACPAASFCTFRRATALQAHSGTQGGKSAPRRQVPMQADGSSWTGAPRARRRLTR